MNRVSQRLRRCRGPLLRAMASSAGAVVLYHEVWVADTSEPLLIFLGLWLLGVPPAMFFDGMRKVGAKAQSEMNSALTGDTSDVPEPSPPSHDRRSS